MEYTVKQLATLAGVSVRTLHYYDEIGLLPPARVTQAGYRLYGPAQVDALQSILFYRALGMPLAQIRPLAALRGEARVAALRAHRAALLARRDALNSLLSTLDKTIEQEEGGISMQDTEKFACFKQALVQKNEAQYGAEARKAYGEEAVEAPNAKLMGLSEEQFAQMQAAGQKLFGLLREAVAQNAAPGGSLGLQAAQLHKEWLCFTWPHYSAAAHRGLAQMYLQDERFTAYYDSAAGAGAAQFLCSAIEANIT